MEQASLPTAPSLSHFLSLINPFVIASPPEASVSAPGSHGVGTRGETGHSSPPLGSRWPVGREVQPPHCIPTPSPSPLPLRKKQNKTKNTKNVGAPGKWGKVFNAPLREVWNGCLKRSFSRDGNFESKGRISAISRSWVKEG